MDSRLKYMRKYFDSRMINKTAFCQEVRSKGYTFSPAYLNMILRGHRPLTEKMWSRINSVLKVDL
jgi:hypothetical protein